MKHGVYVLENPDHDGIVKIGYTDGEMSKRLKGINTTGVLNDWTVSYFYSCDTPYALEQYLHNRFSSYRVKSTREMFEVPVSRVKDAIAGARNIASQKAFNQNQHKAALKESIEKQRTDDFYNETRQIILNATTYKNAAENHRVITEWTMQTRIRLGTVVRYNELVALAGKRKADLYRGSAEEARDKQNQIRFDREQCERDEKDRKNERDNTIAWVAGLALVPATAGLSVLLPCIQEIFKRK